MNWCLSDHVFVAQTDVDINLNLKAFTFRFKRVDQGDHAWLTRSVNRSRTSAIVNRLEPETVYQFAVLAENVLGSGKFSRTVTARTKGKATNLQTLRFICCPNMTWSNMSS